MAVTYPPVGFYFLLEYSNGNSAVDAPFQEVSGLGSELGIDEVGEGGENRYKHRLPLPAKYSNLVLKRGLVTGGSALAEWCKETTESDFGQPIKTQTITVSLLNGSGNKLMSWSFNNAWPVKWGVSDFKSQENAIVIETLEFAYSFFTKVYLTPAN